MKKIIILLTAFACSLQAAQMGVTDKISRTITVRNDFWSCSFIEGSMFPSDFVFSDGSDAGRILFRDTATCDKLIYSLHDERHAESRIIENSADKFIIERSGCFWRNQSPLISPLKGLKVICRYEFSRRSDSLQMHFKYEKTSAQKIVINSICCLSWYYQNPFDKMIIGSREISLDKGRKHPPYKDSGSITLKNKDFTVVFKGDKLTSRFFGRGTFPLWIANAPAEGANFTCSSILQLKKQ